MAFGEPDVHVMFPVPLVTVRLTGCEVLNATLLSEIERRREDEEGIERSNRYGWHSAVDLFDILTSRPVRNRPLHPLQKKKRPKVTERSEKTWVGPRYEYHPSRPSYRTLRRVPHA